MGNVCMPCLNKLKIKYNNMSTESRANPAVEINGSSVTNAAVTCRSGPHGKAVKSIVDSASNHYKVSGTGIMLGSCALDCDTAFWQIKVGLNPEDLRIGLRRYSLKSPVPLDGTLDDEANKSESFYLKLENEGDTILKTGDVVGVYWDQTDLPMLSFTINNKPIDSASILRVRPATDVYPAISVQNGATCDVIFDGKE